MVREKSFRLMGATITVKEKYLGEFEEQRKFIEENKHLFKYRTTGNIPNLRQRIYIPKLKFPSHVMDHIRSIEGSTDLVFLMAKWLDESDVHRGLNRLFNPVTLATSPSPKLTRNELVQIAMGGGLEVIVIDQRGETYSLTMECRPSSGSSNKEFIVTKEWWKLVRDNKFQRGDFVEIWCFRVGRIERKLRLAVYAERRDMIQN